MNFKIVLQFSRSFPARQQWRLELSFRRFPDNSSERVTTMKLKKTAVFNFQYLCNYKSNWFETSEYVYLVLYQHIALQSDGKKKLSKFWFIWPLSLIFPSKFKTLANNKKSRILNAFFMFLFCLCVAFFRRHGIKLPFGNDEGTHPLKSMSKPGKSYQHNMGHCWRSLVYTRTYKNQWYWCTCYAAGTEMICYCTHRNLKMIVRHWYIFFCH